MNKTNYNGIQDEITKETREHLAILNHDSQQMQLDIAVMKEILKRHDKFLWIILAGVVSIIFKVFFI